MKEIPTHPQAPEHVVVLVHGIRTFAHWQERAREFLEKDPRVAVYPVKYGYFNLFQLLSPISYWRNAAAQSILKQVRGIQGRHPTASLSIVAHSFGAYCTCRLLTKEPNIRLNALVLCGALIPDDYPWWLIRSLVRHNIRNDYSHGDPWPAIGGALTIRYKGIGTFGEENTAQVDNCGHVWGHSDYFNDRLFSEWRDLIVDGRRLYYPPRVDRPGWTSTMGTLSLGFVRLVKWCLPLLLLLWLFAKTLSVHHPDPLIGGWNVRIEWTPEFACNLINKDGRGEVEPNELSSTGKMCLARAPGVDRYSGLSKWELVNGTSTVSDLCVEIDGERTAGGNECVLTLKTGFRRLRPEYRDVDDPPHEGAKTISYAQLYKYRIRLQVTAEDRLVGRILKTPEHGAEVVVGDVEFSRSVTRN